MAQDVLISGAHVRLFINGKLFGRVTSFNWDYETPEKEIYGLDSVEPFELAPTIARVSGTVGVYRTIVDAGLEGDGIAVYSGDLAAEKYISIQLIERRTDTTLFSCAKARVGRQSWDNAVKEVMKGSFSFKGLKWSGQSS